MISAQDVLTIIHSELYNKYVGAVCIICINLSSTMFSKQLLAFLFGVVVLVTSNFAAPGPPPPRTPARVPPPIPSRSPDDPDPNDHDSPTFPEPFPDPFDPIIPPSNTQTSATNSLKYVFKNVHKSKTILPTLHGNHIQVTYLKDQSVHNPIYEHLVDGLHI